MPTYSTEGHRKPGEADQEAHQLKLETAPSGERRPRRDLSAIPGVATVPGFHKEKPVGFQLKGPAAPALERHQSLGLPKRKLESELTSAIIWSVREAVPQDCRISFSLVIFSESQAV